MHWVPDVPESLRKELMESEDLPSLYRELRERDMEAAQKIQSQDRYRIVRALSIMRAGGRTISEIRREFEERQEEGLPVPVIKLGLRMERSLLRKRVEQRVEGMLERGLLEETESLINRGYRDWPPLKSVGYKECQQFLLEGGGGGAGSKGIEYLRERIITSTMQLAKRQMTWFRRDSSIRWYDRKEIEDWSQPLKWLREESR